MPDIVLENVTKSWGEVIAVKNFSLKIPDGSFMCFLGPSGCGKTTTLRMIAGLEEPTKGKIYMGDKLVYSSEEAFSMSPGDRDVGLIFQSYALWPHMTVFQNIAFGLEMSKVSSQDTKKRVQEIAKLMGIDDLLKRYPSELSGGQQQRVALARSLAPQPSCLLMDEPLSNLDAKLRVDMRTELKRIHSKTKQTIVYVTHDQIEALSLGTQVVVMNKGELQQIDEPMELYKNPSNLFVAEFVGTPRINMVKGEICEKDGQFGLAADELFFPLVKIDGVNINQEVTLAVRPEDIKITRVDKKKSLNFKIYSTLPTGADIFTRVYNKKIFFTVRQEERVIHDPETEVGLDFIENSLLIYDCKTERLLGKTSLKK
ncbi:MAG: ABC transporter ATP-binding protein [Atribacterota bacterium]|nr:ABC transporter ATP-binding protein [Atribacterota bacterium]MDD3641022.1 ABC transporter ATP-binding protein [Atribacterota bacterium]MDD4765647.1 ABC transporter ATP-binding protein [Atribacterota bacterium]MDI9597240.1 ABC transporter ATP-binding protein [Atribacterota bacterium]